ncbi:MAG: WXG100 family type VII secretion target [Clostridiales bacterium]|nr:WXG100 family type VII secretion target [Clostridiales bacterium]
MSGQIRMTPEQMRMHAGGVRGQGEALEDVINKVQNIVGELQTEWEGKASGQFARQFEDLKPALGDLKQLLDEIGIQLNVTANAVEQLDQEIAGKFRIY